MLVLSRKELKELTGASQRRTQIEHLRAMGIPYQINADGWPVVLREAAVKALGGREATPKPKEATLNLDALRDL